MNFEIKNIFTFKQCQSQCDFCFWIRFSLGTRMLRYNGQISRDPDTVTVTRRLNSLECHRREKLCVAQSLKKEERKERKERNRNGKRCVNNRRADRLKIENIVHCSLLGILTWQTRDVTVDAGISDAPARQCLFNFHVICEHFVKDAAKWLTVTDAMLLLLHQPVSQPASSNGSHWTVFSLLPFWHVFVVLSVCFFLLFSLCLTKGFLFSWSDLPVIRHFSSEEIYFWHLKIS